MNSCEKSSFQKEETLLSLHNLHVLYKRTASPAVKALSFSLKKGECLGIIGESGSGKSTIVKALTGLLPPSARVAGTLEISGKSLNLEETTLPWQTIRGTSLGHIFQDAQQALNPTKTVLGHFKETLLFHRICPLSDLEELARRNLALMNFTNIDRILQAYPFELSGGMCQRVCIALSLCLRPEVLIADEVTSALDMVSQTEVLRLIRKIQRILGGAILFITHDLRVARLVADNILVLEKGEVRDQGELGKVLSAPESTYTNNLLRSSGKPPQIETEGPRKRNLPLLQIKNLEKAYGNGKNSVLRDISLSLKEGEILGILGESGCGKSTLARCVAGLEQYHQGSIFLHEQNIQEGDRKGDRRLSRKIQLIFQDGRGSLNPRRTALEIVKEPSQYLRLCRGNSLNDMARQYLMEAGIPEELHHRRPPELSTGQCQRVAIARALSVGPKLLVCDEAVSALDGGTRNHILQLLLDLHVQKGLSILMISHDMGILKGFCHRIGVMQRGELCDILTVSHLDQIHLHAYTRKLLYLDRHLQKRSEGRVSAQIIPVQRTL